MKTRTRVLSTKLSCNCRLCGEILKQLSIVFIDTLRIDLDQIYEATVVYATNFKVHDKSYLSFKKEKEKVV